jgi:2-(1,2-epoxy-1,2-dihydrophenyl)acetyl-CoA isomerase
MSEILLKRMEAGMLVLTLNRPEQLNALTWKLMRLLQEALEQASADPAVRAVVLSGSGRGFCAGGDIRSREQLDSEDPISASWSSDPVWKTYEMRVSQVLRLSASPVLLHTMPKPTIAMVHGPAAGAGLCLAAACDFRIAADTAVFTTAFSKAARSGDFGGSYLLPRLIGSARARELYLLSEKVSAAEALRIGLVNKVVPPGMLELETFHLAKRLAKGPAAAYRYIKRNLHAAETMTLEQVIELETHHMLRCSETEDAKELFNATREGREPVYRGY